MTTTRTEGNAIIYCERAFDSTNGKTAHGLVRRPGRYNVLSVVDSTLDGQDAGEVLDGKRSGIPILGSIREACKAARRAGTPATHLVVGLAPDGGRLCERDRRALARAIGMDLHVVSGLHDFLNEDPELTALADQHGVTLTDIRRPPPRQRLHFFCGKIEEVEAPRVAVLGTDSAVGKRTTAWMLVDEMVAQGLSAELVGTGQTAWLQGARHGIVLDSLVNDFVSGEIEHAVWQAWHDVDPDAIVVEGQGSLLNPAYPGGFEILAAARPAAVVLQHAPARREYDGFPGYLLHPLPRQIRAIEAICDVPVAAITINHQGLTPREARAACKQIAARTSLPVVAPLLEGLDLVLEALMPQIVSRQRGPRGA